MAQLTAKVAAGIRLMTDDQYDDFCRRYLTEERLDPRPLIASGTASGTDPTILDFGPCPPGLAMEVGGVSSFLGGNVAADGQGFTAGLFLGRIPLPGATPNPSDCITAGLVGTMGNASLNFPRKVYVGREGQHYFLAVYGTGVTTLNSAQGFNSGSVTDPAANANISALAARLPGTYTVTVTVGYGSTPDTSFGNFTFLSGGRNIAVGLSAPLVANASQSYTFYGVPITAANATAVVATAAATVSTAVYTASISVQPQSGVASALPAGTVINATLGAVMVPDTLEALTWL